MLKAELRSKNLARRKQLSTAEHIALSKKIAAVFFASIDLSSIKSVHIFLPIITQKEIDTHYIFERIWVDFPEVQVVVPVSDFNSRQMKNVVLDADSAISLTKQGIPEPVEHTEFSGNIDLVVLPLLAFNAAGHRVGYGGGFYDRFLASNPEMKKVGISFFAPEPIDDINEYDQAMDLCITPERVYSF